ncbi:MAG: amidohydrolase family protein [Woeseiaceae bacterium]|nr:amidohydrolase family protein [Woeseiaceae bacterium]
MKTLIRFTALLFLANGTFAQSIAITDGTVHTVGRDGTIENATVLIEDGLITMVGTNVAIPPGTEIFDANGKIVTPGLFSPVGAIGLTEVGAVAGTNDATQRGTQFAAGFDVANAYNPRSIVVAISRIDGVTQAGLTPRAGGGTNDQGNASHVLSGLGSVVQLGGDTDPFMQRGGVVVANFGESGSNVAGGSRAAAVQVLRAALDDAADYQQNRSAYERGDWRDYSISSADLLALAGVLNGDTAMMFNVNRASDISGVIQIADEYGIRAIITGGSEAWMVAGELASANIPVILDGVNNLPGNFDRINARQDSASLLADAGVTFAFGAAVQTHNARLITQSAGNAVANGLSADQALAAITRVPAEIWGVGDVTGSIEPGKAAHVVIWPEDPLELTSYPDAVFIGGVAIPMVSRQTLLRDRYLLPDQGRPPAFRK